MLHKVTLPRRVFALGKVTAPRLCPPIWSAPISAVPICPQFPVFRDTSSRGQKEGKRQKSEGQDRKRVENKQQKEGCFRVNLFAAVLRRPRGQRCLVLLSRLLAFKRLSEHI